MDKRHILICGERGAGKSTLIRRLLESSGLCVSGFVTVREKEADADGFFPIYLHPAAQSREERRFSQENLIGRCDSRSSVRCTETFESLGVAYIADAPERSVIVMDELGFLENEATEFCSAVLRALEGETHVIAAVKEKDTPFLNAVRASENALVVRVSQANRDAIFEDLLPTVREWGRV